jgi:hypothetical protein
MTESKIFADNLGCQKVQQMVLRFRMKTQISFPYDACTPLVVIVVRVVYCIMMTLECNKEY